MTGDDETNFPHKLLTNRQVANLRSAFAKKSSTDIKLSKSVLIPLGLTAAASAAEAGIYEKILDQGIIIQQHLISNGEMEDIIKIVKSLEGSGLLLKGDSETVQNEAKELKEGFLSMLLGTLGASLLGNIATG